MHNKTNRHISIEYYCKFCYTSDFSDYLFIQDYSYKRCNVCTLVQLVPMPTLEEIKKFYDEKYYATNYNSDNPVRVVTMKRHHFIQYEMLKRNYKVEVNTRFLDFGCGTGGFLEILNEYGHKFSYGFELNSISSKIIIKKGYEYINVYEKNRQTFDIITMWDVAEHLIDPIEIFRLLKSKLNKNGILVIGTARIDDFVDKTSFGYTMWADPPAHTFLYNKKVLMSMLKSVGFGNTWIDNHHTISNIYNSKYQMLRRLLKKVLFYFRTDRINKRGDFGSYLVIVAKK